MRSSSGTASPAVCTSFKRLYQKAFDQEHQDDEADRIAQYLRHVEQRECRTQDETYAVWASEQLDHEYDLPDDGETGTRTGCQIGRELRQYDVPKPFECGELKGFRHLVDFRIERAGAFAHDNDDIRQFVYGYRQDRGGL